MVARAANPFYIEPATPDYAPLLQGIGQFTERAREERKASQAQTDISEAVRSGNAMKVAEAAIKHPQYAQAAQTAFGFTNQETKKSSTDAYRRALSDPENAAQYLQEGIESVREAGGNPVMMTKDLAMMQDNPEGALQSIKMGYAGVDPEGYKSLFGDPKDKFKAQELRIKEDTLELRRLENESRRDEQKLERETNELKRDELKIKIEERKTKMEEKKRDFEIDAKAKIRESGSLSQSIDDFLGNKKYLSAMTGWRGRTPAVTTTGLEAEAYFDQIKNNLTLENLDKMSGVLSETDIKILSGAASALNAGMSAAAMRKEMTKIQNILKTKSVDVERMILDGGTVTPDQDAQALEWANANPNDPRAAQIKQRLGQ